MKYFAYYADSRKYKNVNYTLAAVNKMQYIAEKISAILGTTEIISAVSPLCGNQDAELFNLNDKITVRYFKASSNSNKIINAIERMFNNARFFRWAKKSIQHGETIVVYHSLGYMKAFSRLKRMINFSLVLEVEEIYADVMKDEKLKKKELDFLKIADAYIFPTEALGTLVNQNNKPEIIIHGTYKVEPKTNELEAFDHTVHHVLYAGTFDPRKGGVYAAVSAVGFLPANYHLHVLGFGTEEDVYKINEYIKQVSQNAKARVTYDGLKAENEYVEFLQSCEVWLSTQNPEESFNETSFPSKVLSYFANGLRVVSVRIPVVEKSYVGDMIFYYDKQDPEDIANAIIKACEDNNQVDVRERIRKLDSDFQVNLYNLFRYCEEN